MRVMAVDYGDARTGVAVSDETRTLVGDAWVIAEKNAEALAGKIADEARRRGVSLVVLGYPRNMNGSVGDRALKSEKLAGVLRGQHGLEVELWDERLTTVDAHRILTETGSFGKKRKRTVDAVAASLILEGYLRSKE